jgi:hypothetical protein
VKGTHSFVCFAIVHLREGLMTPEMMAFLSWRPTTLKTQTASPSATFRIRATLMTVTRASSRSTSYCPSPSAARPSSASTRH